MSRIYWANSIFSEADRDFNARCVTALREAGHEVVNPQDCGFNGPKGCRTAAEIFRGDTHDIQGCDTLVACIDQESIDSGVACELGIAWALRKRIIGLYTDFRQHRAGPFRMYKNPYVIGCVESTGRVVSSLNDLLAELAHE